MFENISCFISGDKIEMNHHVFLLGELSEDILNISREEFLEMDALRENMEKIQRGWNYERGDFELRVEMQALENMLLKYKLFRALGKYPKSTELNTFELPVWEPENLSEEEPAPAVEEENNPYEIRRESQKYQQIVHDIYAFNQAMFHFIDGFIKHLDKMDADHYAEALYDFATNPRMKEEMGIPNFEERVFSVSDALSVQYVPRKSPDGNCAIYECFHVERLQSFLKLDYYRALMAGHIIRRCKNCGKFFLLTKGFHTEYCDRPIPGKPHRNCRNQGAKNTLKKNINALPPKRSHYEAYNRVNTDYNRGRITKEERDRARKKLIDLRDEALSGKYRDAEVEALMQPDALYGALNITRK